MDNLYFAFRKKAEPLAKAASVITYPVFKGFDGAIKPKFPSEVRLFGVLVADVHMRDEPYRNRRLYDGIYDLENAEYPIDVLTSAGDLTDHGELSEWATVVKKTAGHKPAKEIVLALGNHDTWTTTLDGDDNYDYAAELFLHFIGKLTGVPEDKVNAFEQRYQEQFGGGMDLSAVNVVDTRQFEVRTPNVGIKVSPDHSDL